MKNLILLCSILLCCIFNARGQEESSNSSAQSALSRRVVGPNTIVKDSSGTAYSYASWVKLVASGNYILRRANTSDTTAYLLIKKPQYQKNVVIVPMPKPEESSQFKSGDIFKPFNQSDIDGERFDLKKMQGKVIVLNFWFINCPPCRAEIPDLSAMANKYKNNPDVIFIAVALDQSYDLKDFLKDNPLNYHVISDGHYIAMRYRVSLYPTNVVIGRDSRVAYSSEGGRAGNIYWMEKTIDAALITPQKTTAAQ